MSVDLPDVVVYNFAACNPAMPAIAGLQAALGYLNLNRVGLLLAWSESRLSRDTDDMTKIAAICKANRVRIRYVSAEGVNPEEGTGKVMNFLNTWQAEEERKKLSNNTKQGLESARLKGKA